MLHSAWEDIIFPHTHPRRIFPFGETERILQIVGTGVLDCPHTHPRRIFPFGETVRILQIVGTGVLDCPHNQPRGIFHEVSAGRLFLTIELLISYFFTSSVNRDHRKRCKFPIGARLPPSPRGRLGLSISCICSEHKNYAKQNFMTNIVEDYQKCENRFLALDILFYICYYIINIKRSQTLRRWDSRHLRRSQRLTIFNTNVILNRRVKK